jgi:FkbM family methyltransferase
MDTSRRGNTGGQSAAASSRKVIYDFGANNGDDIVYYLKKADLVVAVEANPALCRQIEEKFSPAIRDGRLRVENCVVVIEGEDPQVYFYLHKRRHVLGQFPPPDESVIEDYDKVLLPSQPVMEIVRRHGAPYYIKIDIEGYDEAILKELFRHEVRPPFISAEASRIGVFALLAGMGEYRAFKLVDGATVGKKYRSHLIAVDGGRETYSFPAHSAGPFGEDIAGEWMNADGLFHALAAQGLGWKDIHATSTVAPDPGSRVERKRQRWRHPGGWLRSKLRAGRPGEAPRG